MKISSESLSITWSQTNKIIYNSNNGDFSILATETGNKLEKISSLVNGEYSSKLEKID